MESDFRTLVRKFVGEWRGSERHVGVADPSPASWRVVAALDGMALLVDYVEESTDYRGHGVHAWDASAGAIRTYWFDNRGAPWLTAAHARFQDDTLVYDGPATSGARFRYVFGGDAFTFSIADPHGSVVLEGRYTRV